MYATPSPHASTPPVSPSASAAPIGATAYDGASTGHGTIASFAPGAPGAVHAAPHAAAPAQLATRFMTGAYQPSGDPAIDRMIALEAACKRFATAH